MDTRMVLQRSSRNSCWLLEALVVAALASTPNRAAAQSPSTGCAPGWQPTFGRMPGVGGAINAFATYDDGSGTALFAAGTFGSADGMPMNCITKFDGARWSPLGAGVTAPLNGRINALAVYDDGSGPALYSAGWFDHAGGSPASNIARWDGTTWTPLGGGVDSTVESLCVFDDGSGEALYAGGYFTTASGVNAPCVARWRHGQWTALGAGLSGPPMSYPVANALVVHDDGSGPALFAAGRFTVAGSAPASNIARWDGSSWTALGSGVNDIVWGLATHDDGSGTKLYVGGQFTAAGGANAQYLAAWGGANWSSVAAGLNGAVVAMREVREPTGASLFVASTVPGTYSCRVARLQSHWTFLPGEFDRNAYAFASFDDGAGARPYIGGQFWMANGVRVNGFARFDGTQFSASGTGLSERVVGLTGFDDGSGRALFAAGRFPLGTSYRYVGRWDGATWTLIGDMAGGAPFYDYGWHTNTWVSCFAVFDPGTGPALYAGGDFTIAGGVPANFVAKWNGQHWSGLGSGFSGGMPQYYGWSGTFYYTQVNALQAFDDGGGMDLYAGGDFTHAGNSSANFIARWDGSAWSTLGTGTNAPVQCLAVFDDGGGPALYAGGRFTGAGGSPANGVAKWNGSAWTALASGLTGIYGPDVQALSVFDDGSGPALYAGGVFTSAGGHPAKHLAKWDGTRWHPVPGSLGDEIYTLATLDVGSGPELFASGEIHQTGGLPPTWFLSRFDGSTWSRLGSGLLGYVLAMTSYDLGAGPAQYFGGGFIGCTESNDSCLAKWSVPPGCGSTIHVLCEPGSGGVLACPCSNPASGAGRGCDNSSATGGASLSAGGGASLSQDSLSFTTQCELPSALSIVMQGDVLAPHGQLFGQGISCLTGSLRRLFVKSAAGGSITAPGPGDPSLSARSAASGDVIPPGSRRIYGVCYRDPIVLGGCSATSLFNITQQVSVLWQP